MTRHELSQIFYINKEIKMWEAELQRVREESEVKGQEITDMPRGGGTSDKTGERAARIVDLEIIIIGELKKIQLQRKLIMEYMDSIDDSLMRQIIYYRHIVLMPWRDVAEAIGGNSENSIKKIYSRYFK